MNRTEIVDALKKLKEAELWPILQQVFINKGMKDVRINHGTIELGKDLVFREESNLGGSTWYSCVVKSGDVDQRVLHDINRQIIESITARYQHHDKGYVKIDNVIVVTTGVYKHNSRILISEEIEKRGAGAQVKKYWDGDDFAGSLIECDLIHLIEPNEAKILNKFNQYVLREVQHDSSIQVLSNEFEYKVEGVESLQIEL